MQTYNEVRDFIFQNQKQDFLFSAPANNIILLENVELLDNPDKSLFNPPFPYEFYQITFVDNIFYNAKYSWYNCVDGATVYFGGFDEFKKYYLDN